MNRIPPYILPENMNEAAVLLACLTTAAITAWLLPFGVSGRIMSFAAICIVFTLSYCICAKSHVQAWFQSISRTLSRKEGLETVEEPISRQDEGDELEMPVENRSLPFRNEIEHLVPGFWLSSCGKNIFSSVSANKQVIFLLRKRKDHCDIKILQNGAFKVTKYFEERADVVVKCRGKTIMDERGITGEKNIVISKAAFKHCYLFVYSPRRIKVSIESCGIRGVFVHAPNCQFLDVSCNEIRILRFHNCYSLQVLCCANNKLRTLDCRALPQLTRLVCPENRLKSIELGNGNVVASINASYNCLKSFDCFECRLLEDLMLNHNRLRAFQCERHTHVRRISIANNLITKAVVYECVHLTVFACNGNRLEKIKMGKLPRIKTLDASLNQITEFNASTIPNIERLSVWANLIDELDLEQCTQLVYLRAHDNCLRNLNVAKCDSEIKLLLDTEVEVVGICQFLKKQ